MVEVKEPDTEFKITRPIPKAHDRLDEQHPEKEEGELKVVLSQLKKLEAARTLKSDQDKGSGYSLWNLVLVAVCAFLLGAYPLQEQKNEDLWSSIPVVNKSAIVNFFKLFVLLLAWKLSVRVEVAILPL